jgi:hypothetical protein
MVGLKAHWHTWSVIAPYLMDRLGKRTSFSEEFVACSHAETISENDLASKAWHATVMRFLARPVMMPRRIRWCPQLVS